MKSSLAIALFAAGCGAASIPQGKAPPKQAPPHTVGGFSAELPSVTLAPGDEVLPCFIVPLVLEGPSHLVGGARLTVGPGMHHGNVSARPATGTGVRACPDSDRGDAQQALDVLNGGAVLFGSSTQVVGEEWQSFPAGDGYRIADGFEIIARMHYLNASTGSVTVAPRYDWYTIDEATLQHELGPFAWDQEDIDLAPGADVTLTARCLFEQPMHIVSVLPHMHKLGYALDAGFVGGPLDGKTFLTSPGYDPSNGVIQQYDPPVDLSSADGAWFSCAWHNTLDKQVVYGVGDNEMCILFGYAWPKPASYSALVKNGHCVVFGGG
ncbi:MAG TPA: hypothetical protein VFF06_07875 [Polyangia bacterium]|nr:hypothetical protein [Polyangia bacterium]